MKTNFDVLVNVRMVSLGDQEIRRVIDTIKKQSIVYPRLPIPDVNVMTFHNTPFSSILHPLVSKQTQSVQQTHPLIGYLAVLTVLLLLTLSTLSAHPRPQRQSLLRLVPLFDINVTMLLLN